MTPEQVDVVLRGRPLGADTGHGIGLKNVLARLRLHFGGEKQPVDRECARPGHPDNDPPTLAGGSAPDNEGGTVP